MTGSVAAAQGWALWSEAGWLAVMFAAAWTVAAGQFREQRGVFLALARGDLLGGVGLLLLGRLGDWPWALTQVLSSLLQLACYAQLWLASMAFAGQPIARREPLAVVLAGSLAVLVLCLSPGLGGVGVGVAVACCAWVVGRGGWQVVQRLRAGGSPGAAASLAVCCVAVVGVLAGLLVLLPAGGGSGGTALPWANVVMAQLFFAATFGFNVTMAYAAMGRLMRQIHQLQHDDGLTGLPDRGSVLRALDYEWRRHHRLGEPFALLSIGVAQLPAIGARLGAEMAAAVLAEVALALRLRLRGADLLGHAGDGRFLVLMPHTPLADAQALSVVLAQTLAVSDGLHPEDGSPLRLAIGVAAVTPDDRSAADVLRRAESSRTEVPPRPAGPAPSAAALLGRRRPAGG